MLPRPPRSTRADTRSPYTTLFRPLATVFRTKLLAALAAAGIGVPATCPVQWVVHCKAVGGGAKALVYLGRYLYRGVIREQDILACDNGQVTFRYREAASGQWQRRTLDGADFLWRIVRTGLPRGLRRSE